MTTESQLQWGGRFTAAPDPALIAFGSSLNDDLALAPFDVQCSHGHVDALHGGGLLSLPDTQALHHALDIIGMEIAEGRFTAFALAGKYEDIHGAIDARVRELVPGAAGELLHAGRSRNDQVATTLKLYARERARRGLELCLAIAGKIEARAEAALATRALIAATTHWQPAQPVLFAFWLDAAAQPFVRAAERFRAVEADARLSCPLGSGAVAGSSLPLDRDAAAHTLGFHAPSRNAMDSIGSRDTALDLLNACARAVIAASRPSEEFVQWTTPAYNYARLSDAASTGSSLMPQKRNPDPFELVRAAAARINGAYAGALATVTGIGLSYHRDLQETKSLVVRGTEHALAALDAFSRAFEYLEFDEAAMTARAGDGFTVATDLADALILQGRTARAAHRIIGERVAAAEAEGRALDTTDAELLSVPLSALGPRGSVEGKRTAGSTSPEAVEFAIQITLAEISALARAHL